MTTRIAQHAAVDPQAEIDDDVEIGPFTTIGPHVRILAGTRVMNSVTILGHVTIGHDNVIYPNVVIGGEPQDISYAGSDTQVVIGDGNTIREGVTINRGSEKEDGITRIGNKNFLMACSPRGPRLQAGQPHHHGQRLAVGRARARRRLRFALGRRGRAPLHFDRQLQLHRRA